jgi:tRNA/rRNA methyltransferase
MANFGFRRLAVVAPYEEHWREAKSAVGAPELLTAARETAILEEAVANCTLVIGTGTLAHRKPEQPVVALPDLAPRVAEELQRDARIAIVFGPEKRGLTREDLAQCHLLVEIPTHPRQPSMNLGQAVAVCLYEIATRGGSGKSASQQASEPAIEATEIDAPATVGDLERVAVVVEEAMLAANYSPSTMRKANRHDVHLLLRRLALTGRDARRILGLFRRIRWRLQRRAEKPDDHPPDIPHK